MKLVKLDYRHGLKRRGFAYAFLFKDYDSDRFSIEQMVKKAEGYGWGYSNTFYGKRKGSGCRPYYIGFNKESTATLVMLQYGS